MLTSEIELATRKALAVKTANVTDAGYIIPAPIYFVDNSDFWATVNGLVIDTQKEIELTNIAFCVISLLKFEDFPAEGCADEPLVRLTYNFYFFRQYDLERADENELAPDEFLKRNLKSYNLFVKTILDARVEFLGLQNLDSSEFPENFDVKSNSLVQEEYLNESEICRYIPRIKGHSIDLQGVVQVLINEVYV
jgi:hypothetical protein